MSSCIDFLHRPLNSHMFKGGVMHTDILYWYRMNYYKYEFHRSYQCAAFALPSNPKHHFLTFGIYSTIIHIYHVAYNYWKIKLITRHIVYIFCTTKVQQKSNEKLPDTTLFYHNVGPEFVSFYCKLTSAYLDNVLCTHYMNEKKKGKLYSSS